MALSIEHTKRPPFLPKLCTKDWLLANLIASMYLVALPVALRVSNVTVLLFFCLFWLELDVVSLECGGALLRLEVLEIFDVGGWRLEVHFCCWPTNNLRLVQLS